MTYITIINKMIKYINKLLTGVFAFSIINCNMPTGPEEREGWITPPRKDLELRTISYTDTSSKIFVKLKNGQYQGKDPKFHFLVEWYDSNKARRTQEYWTWLYDKGWVDEKGNAWLKDALRVMEPYDTVYTDLNFPSPDLKFPNQVKPEQIIAFWIRARVKF